MMQARIQPSLIQGTLRVPASKSYSQRVMALALLHNGTTILSKAGRSDDEQAALGIIQQAGAHVNQSSDGLLEIISKGIPAPQPIINCGESALSLRMFASILSLSDLEFTLEGAGSLRKRDMSFLEKFLPLLGVNVQTKNGLPPVKIKGPLQVKEIVLPAAESSQYLSGILMAFASRCKHPLRIQVTDPVSSPYVDLTIHLMEKFGYRINKESDSHYVILPALPAVPLVSCETESDWSNAAFWLVAAALSGNIELTGLNAHSFQGDKVILDVLKSSGAVLHWQDQNLRIERSIQMRPFAFDASQHPDLFPPLAVLAACIAGNSRIKGVHRLAGKESNRALTLTQMLAALGIQSEIKDDEMVIKGGLIRGGSVDSGNDHRIVMAASIAALAAADPVVVHNAGAAAKSYPLFFEDLRSLGAYVSLTPETYLA